MKDGMNEIGRCRLLAGIGRKAALGILVVSLSHISAWGQAVSEAEKAYQRGLVAADQQAWDLAISNFVEAQKASPHEHRYLHSLGLTHTRAGHDLAGAAWLCAYLAVSPDAADAAAVRAEIARLEQSSRDNAKKIFAAAAVAARQIPWEDLRWQRLARIAAREADAGFLEEGLALGQGANSLALTIPKDRPEVPGRERIEIKDSGWMQSWILEHYLIFLVRLHDVKKAQEMLKQVTTADAKISAQLEIANGLSWRGQSEGATKLLLEVETEIGRLPDPTDQLNCLLDLADAYTVNRQPNVARKILDKATAYAQKYNMTVTDEAMKYRQDRIAKAEQSIYVANCYDYIDEETDRIDIAQQAADEMVVVNLKGELAKARQVEAGNSSGSQANAIAMQLTDVAWKLAVVEVFVRSFDAVDYKGALSGLQSWLWASFHALLPQAFGDSIDLNFMSRLYESKDEAWKESGKGKAVNAAVALFSSLEAGLVRDGGGWKAVLYQKGGDKPLYALKTIFPDLKSLAAKVYSQELPKEFADWCASGKDNPYRSAYQAAMDAVRGETLPAN